jgi:mono/diheme cytochrome c family protein
MRIAPLLWVGCLLASGLAWGQDNKTAEDIRQGHRLASELCSICHVATPDQATLPIMHPPAPPFATIVRRKDFSAEWLTNFLNTTHRGLDEPTGMPNPDLADFQTKEIVAYLMSLHQQQ